MGKDKVFFMNINKFLLEMVFSSLSAGEKQN